jgi:hypothetical protein
MRFHELMNERVREAYLYHGTGLWSAGQILTNDEFAPKTEHEPPSDPRVPFPKEVVKGVSLSRDPRVAGGFGPVLFHLDRNKLAQRFKIEPMDFWGHSSEPTLMGVGRRRAKYAEAEEFIVGSIRPASAYIVYFTISPSAAHSFKLPEFAKTKELLLNHPLYRDRGAST